LIGAATVIGFIFWSATAFLTQLQVDVREKRETLGRLGSVAALKSALMQQERAGTPVDTHDFLDGESVAIVRGNMQTQVSALISAQSANLLSAGNAPEMTIDGADYLGMRVDISGTLEAVHNAIFAIESSGPLIIRDITMWVSGGDPTGRGIEAPELSAQIQVYGAVKPNLVAPNLKATP
jgi:general secretion pathway protein M